MKKCCKDICITDPETIAPFIAECIDRHKKRRDFHRMILKEGFSEQDYQDLFSQESSHLREISIRFARRIAFTVKNRNVPIFKTWAKERIDGSSGKVRLIGCECCEQRLYDYVIVRSCSELWNRKFLLQQCASVKERGQIYGMKLLRHYINSDNRAMAYAKRHGIRYTRKCKYFVKLDIYHCYESIDKRLLMQKFVHDIGNEDILYLWETLFKSYEKSTEGLLIGALPSQFASQYLISNILRLAFQSPYITHGITYMDDICLFSQNRKKFLKVIHQLIVYAKEELHLNIKPNFQICELKKTPVDMMGYVVHYNGKVTIRARIFLRCRKLVLYFKKHHTLSYSQAKRLCSYKGYIKYSNSFKLQKEYSKAFAYAQKLISTYEKKERILDGADHVHRKTGDNSLSATFC